MEKSDEVFTLAGQSKQFVHLNDRQTQFYLELVLLNPILTLRTMIAMPKSVSEFKSSFIFLVFSYITSCTHTDFQ